MLIFLLVIIGLSVLILGHEAGHFFVAKLLGLKIDEFGFGFPPRIFAWRPKQSPRKSALAPSKVEGSGPRESAVFGETEYSINWLPFGGFVRIAGESDRISDGVEKLEAMPEEEKKRFFFFQPAWKKAVVIGAGVVTNFLLGWILISTVLMVGLPSALVVSGTQPGSPAEAAGFLNGDIISGFKTADSFISFVNENKGKQITLNIVRNGKEISLLATPRTNASANEGALGVAFFEGGETRQGFFSALWDGFNRSLSICYAILIALFSLVKNLVLHGSLLEGVVGPIGIFGVAQDAGGLGIAYLLQLIGLISLNLAVVNLLPLPALDGGRLFFTLIEKIKGSPLPRKIESWVNVAGFAFLILLMVLLSVRDLGALL